MYIHIYTFMKMYVPCTYNLYINMYMFTTRSYMFRLVCNSQNMYIHVCSMFRHVCTVLPSLVQVVRIPDAE